MSKGVGGHHSPYRGKTDEWLTPPYVTEALGKFDLDPCSPVNRPWSTASEHYTVLDDGLKKDWFGRVWLNPPYGPETGKWLRKLSEHGCGTALIFARTETEMFHRWAWEKAAAMLFLEGRLHFHFVDGTRAKFNSGAPSVLIAYGSKDAEILSKCELKGKFVNLQ